MNADNTHRPYVDLQLPTSRQVHTITDRFSMANTYVIDDDRLIIVDPGSDLNVRKLSDYLPRFLQRSFEDIDLIVLTHLHPDHTAGVETLRQHCSAPVAASAVVAPLQQVLDRDKLMPPLLGKFTERPLPGPLRHLDIFPPFYQRQMKLVDIWLNDVEGLPSHPSWRVIASPGHTPESLCLYNPFTYELLCGDTVITIQGGAPLLRSGTNRHRLEETLQVLRSLNVHYLYPGHGRPILGLHPLNNVDVEW